jgi:hypothetical protein
MPLAILPSLDKKEYESDELKPDLAALRGSHLVKKLAAARMTKFTYLTQKMARN